MVVLVASGGENRRLVQDIGQVGSGEAGRLLGQRSKHDVRLQRLAAGMHV